MRDARGRELLTTETPMRGAMFAAVARLAQEGSPEEIRRASALFADVNPRAGLKRRPAWTVSKRVKKTRARGRGRRR